jgi:hypothetical protein
MSMFPNGTNSSKYLTYARVGLAGIALSFALLFTSWRLMYGEQVLGTTSDMTSGDALQAPSQTGQEVGADQPVQIQQNPTQGDTQTEVQLPSSPTTEVTISNPTTEIVIENTDSELVITDVGSQTEIVSIPSAPLIPIDTGGVLIPSTPGQSPTTQDVPAPTQSTIPVTPARDTLPVVTSTLPGIVTTTYVYTSTQNIPSVTAQELNKNGTFLSSVQNSLAGPLSYIGIGSDEGSASRVPAEAVTIQYTPAGQTTNLDAWLKDYQFQVWAVGSDTVAIYRHGITTYTTDAIKLGLSKLSFKLITDTGDLPVIFYPDTVWAYLSDIRVISKDTHDQPMKLVSEGGTLRYLVHAHSRQLLLAAIPVSICRNIVVSVETRDILDTRACTKLDSLFDALSLSIL